MERNTTKPDWRRGLRARIGAFTALALGILFAVTERLEALREQPQGRRAPLPAAAAHRPEVSREPVRLAFAAPRKGA